MWLRVTMFRTKIAEISAARMIAVFQELPCLIRSPSSEIHAQHWFGPSRSAPFDEFIRAESVRLGAEPSQIKPNRSFFNWTNTIFPVVAGKKIAAWITNNRRTQVANQIEHILAKATLICGGMLWLENASINAPSKMLDKRTKHPTIEFGNNKIGIQNNLGGCH